MPLTIDRQPTVKLEIPREEFDKYIQQSEPTAFATAKSLFVTGALLSCAAYGISKSWEVVYMAGADHCFNRALTQCAKKLVNQAFAQASAVPLIGPGEPRFLETVANTWSGLRGRATMISAFSLVNNSVILQVVLGSLVTAAVIKPVKYTANKISAALWPSNTSSTTAKVFKVAGLAMIVLAGVYAAGYVEQMLKLSKNFTCPIENGAQALSQKVVSDIATATPGPLATVSEKFGAVASYFTGTESEMVMQVKEGLGALAAKAKVTQPTLETTQETVNTIGRRIGDAAVIHNLWLGGQTIVVTAVAATTALSLFVMRLRGILNR